MRMAWHSAGSTYYQMRFFVLVALSDIFRPFGSQFNNIILNQSLLRTTLLCVRIICSEMAPKVGTLVDLL